MNGDSYESALVAELQTIAGVSSGTHRFAIRCNAGIVDVVYSQWSSSPSDLTFEARYDDVARGLSGYRNLPAGTAVVAPRPLDIQLRHEDREDRAAKTTGVNVEWQSGDPAFDDAVYVSTPSIAAESLGAILNADVRSAVMNLFALGFRLVHIDHQGIVRAEVTEFNVARPREGRGRDAIDAFARLLMHLPVVTASATGHAPVPFATTTRVLGWSAAIFGLVFGGFAMAPGFFSPLSPTENTLAFLTFAVGPWVALALALPGFFLAKKIHSTRVASAMRGSSRAYLTSVRAGWAAGLCVLFLVACVVHGIAFVVLVLGERQ